MDITSDQQVEDALLQVNQILAKESIEGEIPGNTKHLRNIYTMLDQRRRRWADVV